jgi:hypothetical protein
MYQAIYEPLAARFFDHPYNADSRAAFQRVLGPDLDRSARGGDSLASARGEPIVPPAAVCAAAQILITSSSVYARVPERSSIEARWRDLRCRTAGRHLEERDPRWMSTSGHSSGPQERRQLSDNKWLAPGSVDTALCDARG